MKDKQTDTVDTHCHITSAVINGDKRLGDHDISNNSVELV